MVLVYGGYMAKFVTYFVFISGLNVKYVLVAYRLLFPVIKYIIQSSAKTDKKKDNLNGTTQISTTHTIH